MVMMPQEPWPVALKEGQLLLCRWLFNNMRSYMCMETFAPDLLDCVRSGIRINFLAHLRQLPTVPLIRGPTPLRTGFQQHVGSLYMSICICCRISLDHHLSLPRPSKHSEGRPIALGFQSYNSHQTRSGRRRSLLPSSCQSLRSRTLHAA